MPYFVVAPLGEEFQNEYFFRFVVANISLAGGRMMIHSSQDQVREILDNVIAFHMMWCTTDGCNGPCNRDNKSDVDDLYDSDDSSMSSSEDSSWSGTLSDVLDNWDVDELDNGIDNEDDLMEPASEPVSEPASVPASRPASSQRPSLPRTRL